MNILEALQAAREGKIIRREGWDKSRCIAGIYFSDARKAFVLEHTNGRGDVVDGPFSTESVLATDWVAE